MSEAAGSREGKPGDVKSFWTLCAANRISEACQLIEDSPALLKIPKVMPAYLRALRLVGADHYEETLLAILMETPDAKFALGCLMELHRNRIPPPSVLAGYRARLAQQAHPIFHAKIAMLEMGEGAYDTAFESAVKAIESAPTPVVAALLRGRLAQLFAWFGHLDIADRLIMAPWDREDAQEVVWERIMLRKGFNHDGSVMPLLESLMVQQGPYRTRACIEMLDCRWITDGASSALLEDAARWACEDGDGLMAAERIALAMEIGNESAALAILRAHPLAGTHFRKNLPLATLLRAHRDLMGDKTDPGQVERAAALYDAVRTGTEGLRARLGENNRSIAIVGNSPKELGLGLGGEIDAHDTVIRFNAVPQVGDTVRDYGCKTDVHIVFAGGNPYELPAEGAAFVLLTQPYALSRGRSWERAGRLLTLGYKVATVPGDVYPVLARTLKAPPSSGLRVCSYVKTLHSDLGGVDTYGFAFTDLIGDGAASSHYFEASRPSMAHNWQGEAELFGQLMRRDGL